MRKLHRDIYLGPEPECRKSLIHLLTETFVRIE